MILKKMYRVLKEGGHCYVMTNHVNLKEMLNTFENAGFKFTKSLIWDKRNKIMGEGIGKKLLKGEEIQDVDLI